MPTENNFSFFSTPKSNPTPSPVPVSGSDFAGAAGVTGVTNTTINRINENGGVGTQPYGPPAPIDAASYAGAAGVTGVSNGTPPPVEGGGNTGGGTASAGSKTAPSGPTPWSIATANGLTGSSTVPGLNFALNTFNKANGTNYQLNSAGMIRQNGTGAYMTQAESNAFNASIPVNAVTYKYGLAIDKAIAGDLTDLKNLDKFFNGANKPDSAYSLANLKKEKQAIALGISVAELDKRNAAAAAAKAATPAAPIVAVAPPPAPPTSSSTSTTTTDINTPDNSTTVTKNLDVVNNANAIAADQGFKITKNENVATPAPAVDLNQNNPASPSNPNDSNTVVVALDKNSININRRIDNSVPSAVNMSTNPAQRAVDPAAMAARKAAIESRLQKIAAQRQPYGGTAGATSVVKDSGAMVPPPIAGGSASQNGLPTHR